MKLSIITINYNNRDGLQKTIDSVIAQTWRDFEWIIIDGGSTDGSKELLEQYKDHFSYWCSEPDNGVYNAMNKGIVKAKGDYINFMNSGDAFYDSNVLDQIFKQNYNEEILYGDWVVIENKREKICKFPFPIELYSFYSDNICHQAMFIRTEYQKNHLYDESYRFLADYKNWMYAALTGAKFKYIPNVICDYDTKGRSSMNMELCIEEQHRVYQEILPVPVLISMKQLYYYNTNHHIIITYEMLRRNGVTKVIIKAVLKLLNALFLRITFCKYKKEAMCMLENDSDIPPQSKPLWGEV